MNCPKTSLVILRPSACIYSVSSAICISSPFNVGTSHQLRTNLPTFIHHSSLHHCMHKYNLYPIENIALILNGNNNNFDLLLSNPAMAPSNG